MSTSIKTSERVINITSKKDPYFEAREEWNERYGNYIVSAKNWRLTAIINSVVALVAVIGAIYIGAQSKLVPYVIEIDKLGQVSNISFAERSQPADPKMIKSLLMRWIIDFRAVSADPIVQKAATNRLYKFIPRGSATLEKVNAYYKENSPFTIGLNETIEIQLIGHPLPLSSESWQAEWYETKRSLTGSVKSRSRYKAVMMVAINPPKDESGLDLDNPLGLFIKQVDWSQQL